MVVDTKAAMPRKAGATAGSVVLRLPEAWLTRADDLREYLSANAPGVALMRSDALRAVLSGFDPLEGRLGGRRAVGGY
jgi:hypothetical protein